MATPTEQFVATLVEMGFPSDLAEAAVEATGSEGVQTAMDWILSHKDDSAKDPDTAMQPKSLKCEECGKFLRSEIEAQAHAARTTHKNFVESTEEIKPLSSEEKAVQLLKVEERLKQKRIARQEQEKEDAKEREKLRRKSGKELTEIKQKMELAEVKKLAEERRKEKTEDRLAKQRVRDQIARDREEREACYKPSVPPVTQPVVAAAVKEYSTCRLQIRLLDGTASVQSFKATDTLEAVLMSLGSPNTSFMTTFPKRLFVSEDLTKSLKDLGLVPSAVLIQTLNKN